MWTHLEPQSATLEQVFKPLSDKAREYDHAWSIAELMLSEDEVGWLRSWFGRLAPEIIEEWVKSEILAKLEDDVFVSYRQMFGSLLVCLGAEVCREESREDSVWPAIRSFLPTSHTLRGELFLLNGQPSRLTKDIVEEAVRFLNLRHAMDIEGTQQWYVTIKLQFGFTYRGSKNRLAEWLIDLGRPHAVQYLNGESEFSELSSVSFKSLWRALTQYRRNLIGESEVRETLKRNPWVKAHWLNDILKETKKVVVLGTGEWHPEDIEPLEGGNSLEELSPIESIALDWPQGGTPRLWFKLDRQAIEDEIRGVDVSELDFFIDGRKLCRWIRQRDGAWVGAERIYAEPEKYKDIPKLNPRTIIVRSIAGEMLAEWDFSESGMSEEVLIFDLEKERVIKAGAEKLEPSRRYAIICDSECEVHGCVPIEIFERNGVSRKAIRIASPLEENLCVTYDDFVLWQPVRSESQKILHFSLVLATPIERILSINDKSVLFITGLPENTESAKLLIHRTTYDIQKDSNRWHTLKDVTITPELAAKQRRVRVRFSFGNRAYTQEPRLAFYLIGSAMFRNRQERGTERVSFEVLKHGDQLNRSEGTTNLRIWTPELDKGAVVLEGDCRVGRPRNQKIRLRDFPGNGGELYILCQGERHDLGVHCFDRGCVDHFRPFMLGCDAQMFLLSDKNPAEVSDGGYELYMWFLHENKEARFCKIPANKIQPTSRNRVWRFRDIYNPMAVALTWKGYWLGAWWNLESISDYLSLRTYFHEQDFTIMKWLRIPILHPTLSSAIKKAILRAPSCFIKTWLNESSPNGTTPHDHIVGLDSVVRHFLWNDFPASHSKDAIALLTQMDINWYQNDRCNAFLTNMSDISPTLLWKGMEDCLTHNRDSVIHIFEGFIRSQVDLPPNTGMQQLNYRLGELKKRVLKTVGMKEERLQEITHESVRSKVEKRWHPLEQDRVDLLRLGETHSGRKYLSTCIGQHWLNISH